jgi:hypothetical protein
VAHTAVQQDDSVRVERDSGDVHGACICVGVLAADLEEECGRRGASAGGACDAPQGVRCGGRAAAEEDARAAE